MKKPMDRRTVLRGLGTMIALPVLDAMIPVRALAQTEKPLRLAVMHHPNGYPFVDGWRTETAYTKGIQAMTATSSDVTLLFRLNNKAYDAQMTRQDQAAADGHGANLVTFMNGQVPSALGNKNWGVATTFDQVIAQQKFATRRFPSLGVNVQTSIYGDGYHAPIYHNCISWKGPNNPLKMYTSPKELFDLLFAGATSIDQNQQQEYLRATKKKSILDFVLGDISSLKSKLGPGDRQKLDEYLTSVQQTERTIASIEAPTSGLSCDPKARVVNGSTAYPPTTEYTSYQMSTYVERMTLMQDLMVKAFQCDMTRVFTFMTGHYNMVANYVPGTGTEGWHYYSHWNDGNGDPAHKRGNMEAISNWYHLRFQDLIVKLKNTLDIDGSSMLDNSILLLQSDLGDSQSHVGYKHQAVLAGKAGGRFKSGLGVVDLSTSPPLTNLYLTIMQAFGLNITSYGGSTGTISQIKVA